MGNDTTQELLTVEDTKALVLISKAERTPARLMFLMSHEDAMAFCSDKRTSFQNAMFVWYHLSSLEDGSIRLGRDNGSQAELIEELGITAYDPREHLDLLAKVNLKVRK